MNNNIIILKLARHEIDKINALIPIIQESSLRLLVNDNSTMHKLDCCHGSIHRLEQERNEWFEILQTREEK